MIARTLHCIFDDNKGGDMEDEERDQLVIVLEESNLSRLDLSLNVWKCRNKSSPSLSPFPQMLTRTRHSKTKQMINRRLIVMFIILFFVCFPLLS